MRMNEDPEQQHDRSPLPRESWREGARIALAVAALTAFLMWAAL